ncbi:MAG: ATP-dependent DNA helicase RecG [bacterium]
MRPIDLDTALREVVGGRTAAALDKQIGVVTVGELLHHYPRRYAERGELTDLGRLVVGEHVTVQATVEKATTIRMRSRRGAITEVVVSDGHHRVGLTFFNQQWRAGELRPGRSGLFAGKVTEFRGARKLNNPEYLLFADDAADGHHLDSIDGGGDSSDSGEAAADEFAATLIAVYPATAKLASWSIARAIRLVLDQLPPISEPLPEAIRARHELVGLDDALRGIHRPADHAQRAAARRRLAWDEALGVQLTLAQRRAAAAVNPAASRPHRPGGLADAFDARLPFALTAGQQEVGSEIAADLERTRPMQRLLQGEVGSGKTVVALRAMLQVIDSGAQAALLAPTEVLAAQHARSIEALLGDLALAGRFGAAESATRVALLTGSLPATARREALLDAAGGAAGIVVGTHALIQKTVDFADLGLVVVDEQHRFGVEQRDALRAKAAVPPHLLVMTATPIPRTVAMTVFGDLDVSTLAELPRGRSPISTAVVPTGERPAWVTRAWERVREEAAAGRQAYVVCPRIGDGLDEEGLATIEGPAGKEDEQDGYGAVLVDVDDPADAAADEMAPAAAVLTTAADLAAGPLAGLRVEVLHGQQPADTKDDVMRRFSAGEIDVLVATTVVEVGVDVANATVMVIKDAERYGVSQLHQLRGRVGRGAAPGLCLLMTGAPTGSPARERLDAVAATTDGFALATLDLEQRREGDVLGTSQSGRRSSLKLLSLRRDDDLIAEARAVALHLVEADPLLTGHPLLAAQVARAVDEERSQFLDKA